MGLMAVARYCTSCGARNHLWARTCFACGAVLPAPKSNRHARRKRKALLRKATFYKTGKERK